MKRNLVLLWLAWFLLLYGFQWLVTSRLGLARPDTAVFWSAHETLPSSNQGKIYLNDPFLNRQVAWDSEYYLGIAVGGYDDPQAGTVRNPISGQAVIKNYSFFPLYPALMFLLGFPLSMLGLGAIGTAALAGLIVTLGGTLAGLLALWEMTKNIYDEESAWRAAFYMLIFPSAFFLAQVYTEGLFVGLAFWSLLLMKRGAWLPASLLGILAAWTRAHGAALSLPLGIVWLMRVDWKKDIRSQVNWKWAPQGLCALLPIGAYFVWRYSPLGEGWAQLQTFLFGRGLMTVGRSIESWKDAFLYARSMGSPGLIYFSMEVFAIGTALIGCLWLMKREPAAASFSLAVIVLSVFSGSAQSMARYMLVGPALFITFGYFGRDRIFDKIWTIANILLMGMSVMLFSFDMWVG